MRCSICRRRFARSAGCPEHGAAAGAREPPPPPPPAAELGGLALGALLGHGGFASVWAAELDGRPVAVKIGHRGTDAARRRAAREAAALARLAGEHAPALYRAGGGAPRPYLVMARAGETLERRLETAGAAPAAGELGIAIAAAAAAVHAAGVVHGDLKPDNVALGERVTLLDFGAASLDGAPAPVGASVEYMAPELWRGTAASAASDVYALGVMLYELIAGRPPFTGEARAVGHAHLMLRPALAGFPAGAAALIGRCLAKDPAQRPAAREVAEELHRLGPAAGQIAGAPVHATGAAAAPPGDEARRCVVVVAEVRAEAPAIARAIERHGGELLLVRGARVVAAWTGARGDPARGAVAAARELHRRHGARAFVGVERIAWDEPAQALRPSRANLEPAWVVASRWRGVIGTPPVAALLSLDAPGELVDLTVEAEPPPDPSGSATLDDAAAARLLEQRLGVERIPDAVLARLVALGEGRPRRLVELAAHLRATGAVRRHDALDRTYLAPEAVTVPELDVGGWLAETTLAALPAELRAIAAACAMLEPGFEIAELEAAADAAVGSAEAADPATALVELAVRGLAAADGACWHLTSPALARAALPLLADPPAAAAAALAHGDRTWTGQLDERRRRALARYADAAGDPARAAALRLALAEDGRRAHRDADAEADYTAALAGPLAPADRGAALLGRGVVRYRLDRAADALADLDAAARLAAELGDRSRLARAHLEAATAHDWLGRYDDSARSCEEAARLAPATGDPAFDRALAMARGRTAMRAGRYADARPPLEAAIELEGADPDDDRLIAQLLLGPTLVQLGELDAAERSFAAALADAERLGDGLARCAALGNRVLLWSARRDHARARADLEAARALARHLGHVVPERNATLNLAEYLYWAGELDEAARLADAARELQRRLVAEALEDDVLIARIAAARGDLPAARAALDRAAAIRRAWPTAVRCLRDAVDAFLGDATADLDRIEAEAAAHLVGEERIEVLAWRAATHAHRGDLAAADAAAARARELGLGLQGWRFTGARSSS